MITVHHLQKSQSERIVWLCEELELSYTLKCYPRLTTTLLAPPEYKVLHPLGAAPVIHDDALVLAESAAIVEYLIFKYAAGRLALTPDHRNYAAYLYWFHFSNGNLQSLMARLMTVLRLDPTPDNAVRVATEARLALALGLVEQRLLENPYLAGEEFSAADIMTVFSLTTMRYFLPMDLSAYPGILAYLQRIGARAAYQRAMHKGDPGMPLLLT
jgi:glutathione S-transferase